jgi:hypothetical protein
VNRGFGTGLGDTAPVTATLAGIGVAVEDSMSRSIWKGSISFGLVTVPVAMYSASDQKEELHFRLLHKKDESPVENKRFCKEEEKPVP